VCAPGVLLLQGDHDGRVPHLEVMGMVTVMVIVLVVIMEIVMIMMRVIMVMVMITWRCWKGSTRRNLKSA
jgi:uncharacterized membrane protein YhaH (DUF805 family)